MVVATSVRTSNDAVLGRKYKDRLVLLFMCERPLCFRPEWYTAVQWVPRFKGARDKIIRELRGVKSTFPAYLY